MKRKVSLNPGAVTTTEAVNQAMFVEDNSPGEKEFEGLLRDIKKDLVKIVEGGEEYTATLFAANGVAGLEAAITSAVPEGKKLFVIENGANGARMVEIAEAHNIEVVIYSMPYGDLPDLGRIAEIVEIEKEISHLAVAHLETTTGMLNPVKEICQIANKLGMGVIVDAMSSYAGIPIDIKDWGAEYLISSSNSCIQGMEGIAVVIFKKSLLDKIKDNHRSFYFDIYSQHTGFQKTGIMPFTPPVQVTYALRKAIDEYFQETGEKRWKRYQENWETLVFGLQDLGFTFFLPYDHQSKILLVVVGLKHPAYDFDDMHDYLCERGFAIYSEKGVGKDTFRLSVFGDLHKSDIMAFLRTTGTYLREKGIFS